MSLAAVSLAAVREANARVRLSGRKAVVVGGTNGIGRGLALRLARAGSDVTIAGRSAERGQEVVAEMRAASGSTAAATAAYDFVQCDAFRLNKVDQCIEKLKEKFEGEGLDFLVQTQGMATLQGFTPTEEGLDEKLALHVYSRAAFFRGLRPAMQRSTLEPQPRALSILSGGIHSAYSNWSADPELSKGSYSLKAAADAGGMYNDLYLDALSREGGPPVQYIHASPGAVASAWGTEMPLVVRWLVRGMQKAIGRSVEDTAEYMFKGLCAGVSAADRSSASSGLFRLVDQYGNDIPLEKGLTSEHEKARDGVFQHIERILAKKGTAA